MISRAGFDARQIGDQPRIEAKAAELHAVWLFGSAGARQRHGADELTERVRVLAGLGGSAR